MSLFPTVEEIKAMPLSRIRNLDIRTKEQEEIVQKIMNEKVGAAPIPTPVYRGDVPDIKNVQDEKKWQEVIDLREKKLKIQAGAEIPEDEEIEIEVADEEEVISKKQEPTVPVSPVQPSTDTAFCSQCTSKGVRHLKNCPTRA